LKTFKELFIETIVSEASDQTIDYMLKRSIYKSEANVDLDISINFNKIDIKAAPADFEKLTFTALTKYFEQIGLELKSKLSVRTNIRKGNGFTLGEIIVAFKANSKEMNGVEFDKLIEAKLQNVLDKEIKDKALAMGKHVYENELSLSEGFFSSILGTAKLSAEIAQIFKNANDGQKIDVESKEDAQKWVSIMNTSLEKALSAIKSSSLDTTAKEKFRESFLGGFYGEIRNQFKTLNGLEIKEMFGWEDKLFNDMSRSLNK